ncbi:MAG TPA: helix-turn-helix transcriptional regulator, partial [Methylomirabilota bacterium]|nr:helix-turn-helix transcriptional regulator [Methylomirabilota bacterium]
ASRLGSMRLSAFRFCPDSMGGLLMMSERHFFEHQGALARRAFRLFPATHAVGRAFQELCERTEAVNGFLARCRMLHLIALVFDHELSRAGTGDGVILSADRRIHELMQRLTEDEFIRASSEELAGHCGCSVRHFSRLFRRHFGVSLRMWQTELRLLKARRMLAETNFKVINVASACGYRHLGLFNGLFKRRFSMTPTEWRRQAEKNGHADSPGLVTEK